jgi:acyl carrier protein
VDEAGTPLRGIIHAAGTADDGTLPHQSWPRFQAVLAAKVAGSINLHLETRGRPLDFFVLFSSAAALLGSPGQTSYAAANAFLGALAHLRRAEGLPATAIAWGPWEGLGLAREAGALGRMSALGVPPLEPRQALEAFTVLAAGNLAEVAVLRLDRDALQQGPAASSPLLRGVVGHTSSPPAASPDLLATLRRSPATRRGQLLTEFLQQQVREVLHREASAHVDPSQGFFELGMDSLMALELKDRLEHQLGTLLPSTITFDHPSIGELAEFLGGLLEQAPQAPPSHSEEHLQAELEQELGNLERLLQ